MRNFTRATLVAVTILIGLCSAGCASSGNGTAQVRSAAKPIVPTPLETLTLDLGEGVSMVLVRIPAGEFVMGSPEDEPQRRENEGPQHVVSISRPFYLGQTEVTQAQWRAVLRDNPAFHRGDHVPVTGVKWVDAQTFCTSMSHVTGRTVRLPSEAEWEYACRAGTTTAYSFGDSADLLQEYAWAGEAAPRRASEVCRKQPNPWGLCDMHGNVWEWCEDLYHASYENAPRDGSAWTSETNGRGRVLRGGAWFGSVADARSAARLRRPVYMRAAYVGLRVVVEAE